MSVFSGAVQEISKTALLHAKIMHTVYISQEKRDDKNAGPRFGVLSWVNLRRIDQVNGNTMKISVFLGMEFIDVVGEGVEDCFGGLVGRVASCSTVQPG